DRVVEGKLLPPEAGRLRIIRLAHLEKGADVAAGAESTVALSHHHHGRYGRVLRMAVERRMYGPDHREIEAIQGLRPVEPDDHRRSDAIENDLVAGPRELLLHACLPLFTDCRQE